MRILLCRMYTFVIPSGAFLLIIYLSSPQNPSELESANIFTKSVASFLIKIYFSHLTKVIRNTERECAKMIDIQYRKIVRK